MQHPKTKSTNPDVDLFGAEPLVASGFEHETTEPDFDTEPTAQPQLEGEDHQ